MLGLPYSSFPQPCAALDSLFAPFDRVFQDENACSVERRPCFFVQCDGCFVDDGGDGCPMEAPVRLSGRSQSRHPNQLGSKRPPRQTASCRAKTQASFLLTKSLTLSYCNASFFLPSSITSHETSSSQLVVPSSRLPVVCSLTSADIGRPPVSDTGQTGSRTAMTSAGQRQASLDRPPG